MDAHYSHTIIEQSAADVTKRLNMYMQMPDFRTEFCQIDHEEANRNFPVRIERRKPSIFAHVNDAVSSIAFNIEIGIEIDGRPIAG